MLSFLRSFDSLSHPKKPTTHSSCTYREQPRQPTSSSIRFDDMTFLKKISKAKFPVYLVQANSLNKKFALKAFPYKDDKPSPRFENEIRFAHLSHPHVISMVASKQEEIAQVQGHTSKMSYIVMEYAPYGDLFDLVMNSGIELHEKLVRTYFHQLVEGLECIHSQEIAHLDIKLENILIGEDFMLKIADFDLSYFIKDGKPSTKGTKNYRAPELLSKSCQDTRAADIYSLGVLLFVIKCEGVLPYLEDQSYKGLDLFDLLHNKPEAFWENHAKIQKRSKSFFDAGFMSLFMSMVQINPKKRPSIAEIKSSQWYQGPVYSNKELSSLMGETWRILH